MVIVFILSPQVSVKLIFFVIMYRLHTLYFTLVGILFCANTSFAQRYDFEGELIYHTDDRILASIEGDSASYIRYYVKNEQVRVENITQMGTQVYLRNYHENTAVLLFSFSGQNFALTQDLSKDTIVKHYETKKSCKSIKIGEFKGKQISISGEHLKEPVTTYYSKKFPGYMIDIYQGSIPGLPLKYDLIVQGEKVNYELVKLVEKEVPNNLFEIPEGYLQMTMEDFLQRLAPEEN